jgi:hypothetical protein
MIGVKKDAAGHALNFKKAANWRNLLKILSYQNF